MVVSGHLAERLSTPAPRTIVRCAPVAVSRTRSYRADVVTMTIRPAAAGDAGAIAAIYNEGIEDRVATFETRPREAGEVAEWIGDGLPFLVAEDGGILGF